MKFSSKSYYEHFKWDSVLKPVYRITELKKQENHVDVTVSVNDIVQVPSVALTTAVVKSVAVDEL